MSEKRYSLEVKKDTKQMFVKNKPRGISADAFLDMLLKSYNKRIKDEA